MISGPVACAAALLCGSLGAFQIADDQLRRVADALAPESAQHSVVVVGLSAEDEFARVGELDALLRTSGATRVVRATPGSGPVELERGAVRCVGEIGNALAELGGCEGTLPVRFGAVVPVVPAISLLNGDVDPAALRGHTVLVGTTIHGHEVATAHGLLQPVEIAAHALAASEQQRRWAVVPVWALAIALCLFGFAASLAASMRARLWMGLAGVVSLLGVCLLASATGWFFSPSLPFAAMGFGALIAVLAEHTQVARKLSTIGRELTLVETKITPPAPDTWTQASELLRAHTKALGVVAFELPRYTQHVHVAGCAGVTEAQVTEPRRDVRRAPYARAASGHAVTTDFFAEGAALLLPIRLDAELLGFVAFNAPHETLTEGFIREATRIVAELTPSLHARRLADSSQEPTQVLTLLDRVERIHRTSSIAIHTLRDAQVRLDTLPWPSLSATPWGRVQHVNDAMRDALSARRIDPDEVDLEELVCALEDVPSATSRLEEARRVSPQPVPVGRGFELAWIPARENAAGAFVICASSVALDSVPASTRAVLDIVLAEILHCETSTPLRIDVHRSPTSIDLHFDVPAHKPSDESGVVRSGALARAALMLEGAGGSLTVAATREGTAVRIDLPTQRTRADRPATGT